MAEQSEQSSSKKKRCVLNSQSREIVLSVYKFMQAEKDNGVKLLSQVQTRVAEATGISAKSIYRISKESPNSRGRLVTPNKVRPKGKGPKSNLDDFDLTVVRRSINEFHLTEKQRPTMTQLASHLKRAIGYKGSVTTLLRITRKLGFRWKKSTNNRKVLCEKWEIRQLRIRYLRKLQQYRNEGRAVFFMDETYVHSSHTQSKGWTDNTNSGLKTPISKGNRLIVVHAGNENGFVNGALVTFQSGRKSGDYHDDMNFVNYEKWLKTKLIPNLPERSVLVIDNAPYHNVQVNRAPTFATKKAEMQKWLSERSISYTDSMLKPELYDLIKLNKPRFKMFRIDSILAEAGHSVLRLPPYHPDLNPIELIWSMLKGRVGKKNTTFVMKDVEKLVEQEASAISKEEWGRQCEHVRKVEEEYMKMEPFLDRASDEIIISTGDDSDSDNETESESYSTDEEAGFSGVEELGD